MRPLAKGLPMPIRSGASWLAPVVLTALSFLGGAGFAAAHAGGAMAPAARCAAPEYRQFDFWLGSWDVQNGGRTIASSHIGRGPGGCTIEERYSQEDGYSGESASFYDAVLRQWRQTWVDAEGSVGEFAGQFRDGAMRFDGETHTRDGQRILRRLTLSAETPDRVRQRSEASSDGGITWRPHYDFVYVRQAGEREGRR
jgi:hypothetical protein